MIITVSVGKLPLAANGSGGGEETVQPVVQVALTIR